MEYNMATVFKQGNYEITDYPPGKFTLYRTEPKSKGFPNGHEVATGIFDTLEAAKKAMKVTNASASELYPIMAGTSKWFVHGPGNTKVAGPFKSQEEAETYIKSAKSSGASFFKNGADRARLEIQNKLVERGFRVENGSLSPMDREELEKWVQDGRAHLVGVSGKLENIPVGGEVTFTKDGKTHHVKLTNAAKKWHIMADIISEGPGVGRYTSTGRLVLPENVISESDAKRIADKEMAKPTFPGDKVISVKYTRFEYK
jgi:hypothetical protein